MSGWRPGTVPPVTGIEVVELSADREADYFALFDAAFRDNPEWAGCYCAFHDRPSGVPFDSVANGAQHRCERAERIRSGAATGLLAYSGATVVGWCNVAPRSRVPNLRSAKAAVTDPDDDPAVIMCYVIHPDWRGRGVAGALTRGAVAAARRWGSPWLEGYPVVTPDDPDEPFTEAFYTGPLSVFLAAGFTVARELSTGGTGLAVVRHDLAS